MLRPYPVQNMSLIQLALPPPPGAGPTVWEPLTYKQQSVRFSYSSKCTFTLPHPLCNTRPSLTEYNESICLPNNPGNQTYSLQREISEREIIVRSSFLPSVSCIKYERIAANKPCVKVRGKLKGQVRLNSDSTILKCLDLISLSLCSKIIN
jgi:hypothetical protein